MPVAKIIEVNRGRWEIEESFMLMKSELKSRPVYVRTVFERVYITIWNGTTIENTQK